MRTVRLDGKEYPIRVNAGVMGRLTVRYPTQEAIEKGMADFDAMIWLLTMALNAAQKHLRRETGQEVILFVEDDVEDMLDPADWMSGKIAVALTSEIIDCSKNLPAGDAKDQLLQMQTMLDMIHSGTTSQEETETRT